MSADVNTLAKEYALEQYPIGEYNPEPDQRCERINSEFSFKAGFNKCLELMIEVISDYDQSFDKIFEFIEKHKVNKGD